MEELIVKTITCKSIHAWPDDKHKPITISAERIRGSNGYCSIVASFGPIKIEFNSDQLKDEYEVAAKEFVECLSSVCEDPCNLPQLTRDDDDCFKV